MDRSGVRAARLNKSYQGIISGNVTITPHLGPLFLEAFYTQPNPVDCVTNLVGSKAGLSALQEALRYDLSPTFLNLHGSAVLRYLRNENLKLVNNGLFLSEILMKMANPPIFWMELRKSFLKGELNEEAMLSFGWLLLQLCLSPSDEDATRYRQDADMPTILNNLRAASSPDVVAIAGKIEDVLNTVQTTTANADTHAAVNGPGGRHDNDFADFRKISILPTGEELQSTAQPFLRPSSVLEDPNTEPDRVAIHLDNQFRLLREDMLYEMREEVQIATNKKKGFHRGFKIKGCTVVDIDFGKERKTTDWALICRCKEDFPQMKDLKEPQKRKDFLCEKRNLKFFKHQSLACLLVGNEVVAFPSINRDEDLLAKNPPEVVLQFEDGESTRKALYKLKTQVDVTLIQIDTALFAYEPILRGLQRAKTLPLSSELLLWKEGDAMEEITEQPTSIVHAIRDNPQTNLKHILSTATDIRLDSSQAASLISGLTQKVSLIQGPPGTGKSFIGALLAKAIHDHTEQRILVVCYTNHALDDILTSLLDINIPQSSMVRLGGKSTSRTEPLKMRNQPQSGRSRTDWTVIDELKGQLIPLVNSTTSAFKRYNSQKVDFIDVLDYLEIEDPEYYAAFCVPESDDGMQIVGQDGKAIRPDYLVERWCRGLTPGAFRIKSKVHGRVWDLPIDERKGLMDRWKDALLLEAIEALCDNGRAYNRCQKMLSQSFKSETANVLRSKRILGCTTTAAAMYRDDIQAFNPNVLLVEEAGEILESHVLTSLGPETSQMILIGDHKQLRPKVNNYLLTVEKDAGYDLNRSLFERLILKEYPHQTLSQQHRMRPEISSLIRHLTYPELIDAPKTLNRPNLLGVQDNIVFIHHENPEDANTALADKIDIGSTTSKQNSFEIAMILKIVKYLAQQGYGTDKLVILTPYLGQLQKLRSILQEENDPVLNDLDSAELIRAGLLNPAEARLKKNPIHLATIDNYQGEESDIVIVSLTRSNPRCDIGFMFSPERLNVLLSRARNALIMLGNANTFKNARKGKELWQNLFELLGHDKHIYSGLPVKCQRHPDTQAILETVDSFESMTPDGGCTIPCGKQLPCGHECPSKCHAIVDHSKVKCKEMQTSECPNLHPQTWPCHAGVPQTCHKCDRLRKLAKEKQQYDLAEKARRDAEEKAHLQRMDALNAEIERERQLQEDISLAIQRANAIKQKEADLAAARALQTPNPTSPTASPPTSSQAPNTQNLPSTPLPPATPPASSASGAAKPAGNSSGSSFLNKMWDSVSSAIQPIISPPQTSQKSQAGGKPFVPLKVSPSEKEWQRLKSVEGATSNPIDAIMDMIGLEAIKEQVLKVKAKIDTARRQNASIKKERFNAVLLGNPGTGKTTVARHYSKFLADVKVVPGDAFIETTGARLAQEGVDEAKKLIEGAVKSGGGAIFIDEAYQLTNGNNYGGPAVLDFLLAEMENNVGTLIFIMAGYNKEMEKFFEHNPGLKSRVPYQFNFADYKDEELMAMFEAMIKKAFSGRMALADGIGGLYSRIAIRRLGRRRGQPGFGNARDLEQMFARIRGCQAARLTKNRRDGLPADDFFMDQEDLIGPDPTTALLESESWKKLQTLIGLTSVKESVASLFNLIGENYQRELEEKEPMDVSLNRVFLGSPGTGKTTVAKLYGQILADLGLLTNGEVVTKNPADFVGAVLGASEVNTKAILANTVGKVLIIDEAYMLYGGGGKNEPGGGSSSNQFKTSVIDTIVAEVQNVPGEDRCVLMLGYKNQMVEMFQNVNPGLSRRFKIEEAFTFEDFTDTELLQILDLKLKLGDLDATDAAKKVALELLIRMRNRPNFGNAGEVENIITQAKGRCVARRAKMSAAEKPKDIVFEPQDFDPEFNRGATATANLIKLFDDVLGCDDIIKRLKRYQELALVCKKSDRDPRKLIPMNFVFTGPPGTGKTTVARKMGQVFYDMGILGSGDVVECSASDLVGQFVGQTGPKTKTLFEKALGKVLFIDEAYRLSEGQFAQEAIDELVGLLTHPSFKSKLIVILAGYENDINRLLSVNAGLSSRFPDQIIFPNIDADSCMDILRKELTKNQVTLDNIDDKSCAFYVAMRELIMDLSELNDWGNARDMMTLSKSLVSKALLSLKDASAGTKPSLSPDEALDVTKKMLQDRQRRSKVPPKPRRNTNMPQQSATFTPSPPPPPATATAAATRPPPPRVETSTSANRTPSRQQNRSPNSPNQQPRSPNQNNRRRARSNAQGGQPPPQAAPEAGRDPGVSDAVWQALNAAKRAAAEVVQRAMQAQRAAERKVAEQKRVEEAQRKKRLEMERAIAAEREAARRAELERQREAARRKEEAARAARQKAAEELRAMKEAERQRQEREEKAQHVRLEGIRFPPVSWD